MNDSLPAPSPLLKATSAIARAALWLMLSAWFLLAAGWGALHLLIVPRIGELRPYLEVQVSKVLGVPVKIGSITAYSVGLIPSFELTEVKLLDAQSRPALTLPRVLVALSPQSVLGLGFEQVYIDSPELIVRRTAQGKIMVAGLDFSKGGNDDGSVADWVFSQREFVIRNGRVSWTDEMQTEPTLDLSQVDLVMRNHYRNHSLRLDATPPQDMGDRFQAMAVFRQPLLSRRNGQWRDWDGQLYGSFARVDVSRLGRHLGRHVDSGLQVAQGNGALRVWADITRGDLTGATADVALANVSTTLDRQLAPLELHSATGRLGGRFLSGGFEFQTQGLQFETRDGLRWPGGNVRVTQVGSEGKVPGRGELVADKLDLAVLAQIADRLPLGQATHAALAVWAPKGLVESIKATWQGSLSAPEKYEAKGRVTRLELASRQASGSSASATLGPALRGATVDFDLTQAGGKAMVAMDNGAVELPLVFEDPLVPVTQLSADVQWQTAGQRISVQVPKLKFSNADGQGEAQLKWQTSEPNASRGGGRFPGVLDLQGNLTRVQGTRVFRYLPKIMLPRVRDYVRDAVQKGTATGVKFKVKGDLYDMPFTDPKLGEFRIAGRFADATFAYVPRSIAPPDSLPWPELTQMAGELVIDRLSLQVKDASGRLAGLAGAASVAGTGLQITRAEGLIPDLLHATVNVTAEARGGLTQMIDTVNGSPLGAITGSVLAQAVATGNADLRLKLALPVSALDKTSVQGSVTLANNDVQWSPSTPRLSRAKGIVSFSEGGFAITNGQARMLGGDMTLAGGTVPASAAGAQGSSGGVKAPPLVVLRAQGSVTAEALRQAKDLGFVSRIALQATGSASYSGVLGLRRGVPELQVSTNLVGMALNLPAPMGKTAEAPLPVRFETGPVRETALPGGAASPVAGPPGRLLDQLQLDVGRIASIVYVRDVSGADARVVRGGIAVGLQGGESAPMPTEGVVANINLTGVDLDAWSAALTHAAGTSLTVAEAPVRTPSPGSSAALSYLPTSMAVRARELTFGGRKLSNVVVGGTRDGLTWRANMDARELNGYVEYRQASGAGPGRVYARLARLTLAQASAADVESLLDEQPATIPALDIVVEDLELRGKRLGRVEVEAINRGAAAVARDGGAREWRLSKFNVIMPEAVFTATGNWANLNAQSAATAGAPAVAAVSERRRTVMNFKLDINDAGDLLNRLGMKDVIRRGKGKLEGQVAWVGSPLSPDYPSMGGSFKVGVESGQFLKADPGIAKLLGVLSLQSLPRRLALDFRDVFSEGFSFDFVRGDVNIDQGIASTNNLQMKGVNAAVLMDGRADIAKETQDIRVVVVPEINAGTASLIATAINPAIGLGTFLAQVLLRGPLIESSTQEFHIDGTWLDPKVTQVARKSSAKNENRTEAAR